MFIEKFNKKSNEIIALLLKHGCWKTQVKVQRNYNFAPETLLLEISAKSPTTWQLGCHRHWKSQQKVQRNSSFAPETWSLEKLAKIPTKWLFCS